MHNKRPAFMEMETKLECDAGRCAQNIAQFTCAIFRHKNTTEISKNGRENDR